MSARPNLQLVDTDTGEVFGDVAPELREAMELIDEQRLTIQDLERDLRAKRALIRKLRNDEERDRKVYEFRSIVEGIFAEWQEATGHKNSKLTGDRFDAVRALLEKGYTPEQFSKAIAGAAFDPFCTTRKNGTVQRHDDLELICRDGRRFESFACRAPR